MQIPKCRVCHISLYLRFVWRQSEFAFFGAVTSVAALFDFYRNKRKEERKMKKLFTTVVVLLTLLCIFTYCDFKPQEKEDVITVEDGYLVVNGIKTEHKVDTEDDYNVPTEKPDTIEVVDGYLVVNGTKTELKVHTEPVVSIIDGYVSVNGIKTEHKVHTEPIVTEIDGYVAINGIKTKYKIDKDDVVTVEDGYLVVNGTKTEHKVHTEPVISVIDGYVVVNGVKTEHKVHTEPIISVIDGYVAVNGVKTEYLIATTCNHVWNTVTTAPTCTVGGYDTMTCPLCDKSVRVNETEPIAHTYETTYTMDNDYHWYQCTECGFISDKSNHILDSNLVCEICNSPILTTPGIIYDLSADGTYAEVIGYNGTATNIKIAEEYNGFPVKSIYDRSFYNKNIISVVIPNSVTNIGYSAFSNCTNLTSVVMSNALTSIDSYAFENCKKLYSINLPDSLQYIGSYTFSSCSSLISIVIPNGVKTIPSGAFSNCTNLSSVVIPDSVTAVDSYAFGNCPYTEYENGKYIGDENNPYAIFIGVTNSTYRTYHLNPKTRVIEAESFTLCSRMTEIYIPENLIGIGYDAFECCSNLSAVHITDLTSWCNIQFDGCDSNPLFYAKKLYLNNELITNLVIPKNVTKIVAFAFYGCTSITSVTISNNVTKIEEDAFGICSGITSLIIPETVTVIGDYAFTSCDNLSHIYYMGSKENWANINIGIRNESIKSSIINYNYVPEN